MNANGKAIRKYEQWQYGLPLSRRSGKAYKKAKAAREAAEQRGRWLLDTFQTRARAEQGKVKPGLLDRADRFFSKMFGRKEAGK